MFFLAYDVSVHSMSFVFVSFLAFDFFVSTSTSLLKPVGFFARFISALFHSAEVRIFPIIQNSLVAWNSLFEFI